MESNSLGNFDYSRTISNEYILLNEKEILDFIKDIDEFIDLINVSLDLFKKYFPKAKYYLALEEDYESSALDALFVYIINKDGTFEENYNLSEIMLDDFIKLHKEFPLAWMKFDYIVEEDDEYYELWRKGIIDNY